MHFETEPFGPSFSYGPGERRKLPSGGALRSFLDSLTLAPLSKRLTLDTVPYTSALGLEENLSLGLSFQKAGGIPLPASESLLEVHHSLHIGSNCSVCGNYYPQLLARYAKEAHTKEFRKIIGLLRTNGYIRRGPEAVLYEEIAERRRQYPDFSPLLFLSPAFLFYLSNTRPMTKDGSTPHLTSSLYTLAPLSLNLEFEGCLLIIEPVKKDYPNEDGEDPLESLQILRDFEFAVLARPQIETRWNYEYSYDLKRAHRSWGVEMDLRTWMGVNILPRESEQTHQDKVEHILAKDASRFLDIS